MTTPQMPSSRILDHQSILSTEPGTLHLKLSSGFLLSSSLNSTGHTSSPVPLPQLVQGVLYPLGDELREKILESRAQVRSMLNRPLDADAPLLVITGPSSISDVQQIRSCANWIKSKTKLQSISNLKLKNPLILLRANMSAVVQDTHAHLTFEILQGLPFCRSLLIDLAEMVPVVGELSDTLTPQYFSDLYAVALISSTYVESQLHRESVSGCSYSVGFGTQDSTLHFDATTYDNKVSAALDAMYTASQLHLFLSMTKIGQVAVTSTLGNTDTFIVLELNLDISLEEISRLVTEVYSHSLGKHSTPKIIFDVGKLDDSNYGSISSKLMHILESEMRRFVVGIMVDSGDTYDSKESSQNLVYADKIIDTISSINGA